MAVKRRALITGASAGLGVEFARQLAGRGVDLLLVARRADKLEAVAEAMRKAHGIDVQIFADDLSHPEAPARIEAHVREHTSSLIHGDMLFVPSLGGSDAVLWGAAANTGALSFGLSPS